jgi:hypothetical protein
MQLETLNELIEVLKNWQRNVPVFKQYVRLVSVGLK